MKTQDEINEIRKQDEKRLADVKDSADSFASQIAGEIGRRAQEIKEKIQALMDKKHDIFDAPYSRAHTVEMAKKALREKRKQWFIGILLDHLKTCQTHAAGYFHEPSMRLDMGSPEKVWRLLFNVITEQDIEEAGELLPDIGMTPGEKENGIKKIDEEIAALQAKLKEDLTKPVTQFKKTLAP